MKVGILTMHYRRNYGGILQAYALSHIVQQLNHDVEIIDFRYNAKENRTFVEFIDLIWNKILSCQKQLNKKKGGVERRELPSSHIKAFNAFKKAYLRYSYKVTNESISEIVNNYDAIIVGSDQVWNYLKGKHLFYFFDFGKPFRGKKISYAPCSVVETISRKTQSRLKRLLLEIDSLSVRDVTTQKLVTTSSGITPKIVLDPTFLYSFNEFVSQPIIAGDYVFAYILGSEINGGHQKVLDKIFEKYGKMKVVAAILPDISLEVEKFADEIKYNASPDMWVNLISNAKFVYTDSFHGCVFSLKFHKPFYAYYKDASRTSRLIDLKESFGISSIHSSSEECIISDENYTQIDNIINQKVVSSLEFLKDSLS